MKIKEKQDLESYLNMIYEHYILANNSTLDEGAIRLKKHYEYVIKDLELHDCLEVLKGENHEQ